MVESRVIEVSIGVKKGIMSVVLLERGKCINRKVSKIRNGDVVDSVYASLIYSLDSALRVVRSEMSEPVTLLIEVNNANFVSWVEQGYAVDKHQEAFKGMYRLLNSLPLTYKIVNVMKPRALYYASERYLDKVKSLKGLDLSDF